ncbi:hypothetical protein M405DRAFT_870530 [Rhizopogon salebrosus TDB-379]|nr:hypothetical protein M405DRAFT_870530 [Rhizopogon salebrosus TDB-379]
MTGKDKEEGWVEKSARSRQSFHGTADYQQIKIFKPGTSIAASSFKRRNTHEDLLEVIIAVYMTGKYKEGGRAEKRIRFDWEKWHLHS